MEKNTPNPTIPTAAPATTAPTGEELCGSTNILDTEHLKNLVDDLSKIAAEKRLIEAIRANLDRYEG